MIVRGKRPEGNFYILDKAISEDRRLSWGARGLLIYLLGKPNHWQVSTSALINETADSSKPLARDGVHALMRELIQAGYCTRHPRRSADGTMSGVDHHISEAPRQVQPDTAQPDTVNPRLVSIEGEVRIEKTRKSASATRIHEPTFNLITGKFDGITLETIALWTAGNPGVNVETEIVRASCWLIANPERNKSRYLRFLSSWMTRACNRPAIPSTDNCRQQSSRERSREDWASGMRAIEKSEADRRAGRVNDANGTRSNDDAFDV
jgi:hypothetical protein